MSVRNICAAIAAFSLLAAMGRRAETWEVVMIFGGCVGMLVNSVLGFFVMFGRLVPAYLALVAEVYEKLGRLAEGLSVVSDAFVAGQQSGQHYREDELYRLRGALTLRAEARPGRGASSAAEDYAES